MRHRFVIALLVGIVLAPLLSGGAAEPARMFHVGMVNLNLPRSVPFNVAFEQRLRELGHIEGKTLAIDSLSLDGKIERFPEAMEELGRRKVDVILAAGQEASLKAAKQATSTIPIVMIAISYDPGGNITGVFLRQPELAGKRLELLKQMAPDIARAIVFWDRDRLAELALRHRMPSMFTQREIAEAGGLISYGTSVPACFGSPPTMSTRS
jgi:putative ABC transport system substrate-binding protein